MRALLIFSMLICLPALPYAFLCDDEFFLQGIKETYRSGSAPNADEIVSSSSIPASLEGIQFLSDSTQYRIISGFRGACSTPEKQPVSYRLRAKGASGFAADSESLFVKLFSNPLAGTDFSLWFGFGPDTTNGQINLSTAIGSVSGAPPFRLWYATSVLIDSVRSPETGLWQVTSHFYPSLFCYADSARLDSIVFADWRAIPFDGANRRGRVFAQFLQVLYDTVPAARINLAPSKNFGGHRTVPETKSRFPVLFDPAGRAIKHGTRCANGVYFIPESGRLKLITEQKRK